MGEWEADDHDVVSVLHVDDDEAMLDLTRRFLERIDDAFEVTTAVGAHAGLDVLADADVDCVVSDYQMPELDGLAFLERVRETHPQLPFVLFTGEGSETVASDAIAAGATDYVPKGTGTDRYRVLANRVRNAVEAARAKREQRRTAERFQRVSDTAPVPIGIIDDEFEIRYTNDAGLEFFGVTAESELLGRTATELVHPEDRERAAERLETVLGDRESPAPLETRFLADDGTRKVGMVTSAPITFDGGPAAQVVIDDVTAARDAVGEWSAADAVAASLFQAIDGLFFVFELGYGLTEWNDRVETVTGYEPSELDGAPASKFVPEEYSRRAERDVETIVSGGDVRYDGELLTADGERIPYEFHFASHEAADGTRYGVGLAQEITERVERERRIRERKEQLETIVENFPVVAFTVDREGTFTRSVGAGLGALGVEPGELVGESIYEGYGDYDGVIESFERALDGESAESTVTIQGVTFETRYQPVVDGGSVTEVVGVAFDVTDRVEQRRALEAKNARLEEFASVLSHDLRNPLGVASGSLEAVADHVDDAGVEHVETVRSAHDRIDRIVDDVLALARGGGEVDTRPVAGDQVVALAVESVETDAVDVEIEYDAVVLADEGSFVRLVENLVGNAVEHGGDRVVVGGLDDDPGFYVADDGPGLCEDAARSVFEPGVTSVDNGTGLGLAIVDDIAQAHDWSVDVATDPTLGGARFEVRGVDPA